MKTNLFLLGACLAASLAVGGKARAQAEWTLDVTDTNGDIIDLLLTSPGWNNPNLATIGGTFTIGGTSTALSVIGFSSYAGADNLLFANDTPPYDFGGISFTVSDGNIYNIGGELGFPLGQVNSYATDPNGEGGLPGDYNVVSETLTQVPEPLSASLLIMGMTALAVSSRRRAR